MNKSLFKKVVASAMAFGLVATAFSTTSFAAADTGTNITGTTNVVGGTVGFQTIPVELDGTQTSGTANWTISDVTDARGTGAGWEISLTLTQFKEYDTDTQAYVTGGKVLANNSLKVSTPTVVSQVDSTSSSVGTITAVAADTPLDTGSSIVLLDAAKDGGMGTFSFSALGVTLTVPANTYAKTYKTDATVTLTQAPL